jgi:hypothetical protein
VSGFDLLLGVIARLASWLLPDWLYDPIMDLDEFRHAVLFREFDGNSCHLSERGCLMEDFLAKASIAEKAEESRDLNL